MKPSMGGGAGPTSRITAENLRALPRRDPVLPGPGGGVNSGAHYTCTDAMSVAPQQDLHTMSSNSSSSDSNVTTLNDAEGNQHRQRTIRVQGGNLQRGAGGIQYKGTTLREAAEKGNLPLCVLIWGMAAAEKVNLMTPDELGNNPLHYAVRAETPEVMGFIYQQAKGQLSPEVRLVDAANLDGETPLLRACYMGKIPIVKALLDEGSDPFRVDKFGCTVFSVLAKSSHLWCLNFVFFTMVTKFDLLQTLECMSQVDCDGHSCLDWAASSGDVNIIEFLIRKGMNPQRVNKTGRGPLYWAVNSGQMSAVRFLAKAGCNPYLPDHRNTTPRSVAKTKGDSELLDALAAYSGEHNQITSGSLRGQAVDVILVDAGSSTVLNKPTAWDGSANPSQLDFLYSANGASHAVHAVNTSRITHTLLHTALVVLVWVSSLFIPFWCWFGLVALSAWVWRFSRADIAASGSNSASSASSISNAGGHSVGHAGQTGAQGAAGGAAGGTGAATAAAGPTQGDILGVVSSLCDIKGLINRSPSLRCTLLAREKYLGLWLGTMCAVGIMLLCCITVVDDSLGIMGISSASHDSDLFWTVFIFFFCCLLMWLSLCFMQPDPGGVDTRMQDFDGVLNESIKCGGAPPQHLYCPTTLMKKPTRAKYCTSTGLLIARMDHHCVWLNNSVGFGNHRRFLLFVIAHFIFSICTFAFIVRALSFVVSKKHLGSWAAAKMICSSEYFYVTALAASQCVLIVFLFGLLCEQVVNVCMNLTVNERLNRSRYYWMHDAQGRDFNRCASPSRRPPHTHTHHL